VIALEHIHPILVHFPIVFIIVLAVFDLVATARGATVSARTPAGNVSTGLAVLAGLSAVVTYLFGGMALDIAEAGGFSSDIAEMHEGLGETVAIVLAIWAIVRAVMWWRGTRVSRPAAYLFPLVAIAGAALVVVTAYYGGELVYQLGVNVGHAGA
jgi:uncharacterized membrane protein